MTQYKPVSSSSFIKAISSAKAQLGDTKAPFVSIPDSSNIQFAFLSDDRTSGYAISAFGEIIGVFSLGKGNLKHIMESALRAVRLRGYLGAHLHCFEPLVPVYEKYGFKVDEVYSWDAEQAPSDWNPALGKPNYCRLSQKFYEF